MKYLILGLFALLCVVTVSSTKCEIERVDFTVDNNNIDWIDITDECVASTKKQIEMEVQASIVYLSYASYFSKDTVNRPGFAKFFFGAAGEEREHATKLIEYLSMRGVEDFDSIVNVTKLLMDEKVLDAPISTIDALKRALTLETLVTKNIRVVIEACEGKEDKDYNHYHFVDYLTGEFLEEQYKGQRELAGKISTLGKMLKEAHSSELAEFLFDKTLL